MTISVCCASTYNMPILSIKSTRVFGSVVTVIGVKVVAFPVKSVSTVGTVGGIVSVTGT